MQNGGEPVMPNECHLTAAIDTIIASTRTQISQLPNLTWDRCSQAIILKRQVNCKWLENGEKTTMCEMEMGRRRQFAIAKRRQSAWLANSNR